MNFEDKLNHALAIAEADMNRRNFLKKGGSGAAAMAVGSPAGIPVGKIAAGLIGSGGGSFTEFSDGDLMETPEAEWINKIPYARLLRIMKDPWYAARELPSKILTIGTYGPDHWQAGSVAKLMRKAFLDSGGDIKAIQSGILETIRMQVDAVGYDSQETWILTQSMLKNTRLVGLKIDEKAVRQQMLKDIRQRKEEDDYENEQLKIEKEKIDVPRDYAVASPMHQVFENKLNSVLAQIV